MLRSGVNRTRVVEEAEQVAGEVGLPSLTLTVFAERLGVRQPSLYKHIDGLPGLHRCISVRRRTQLADVLACATVGAQLPGVGAGVPRPVRRRAAGPGAR